MDHRNSFNLLIFANLLIILATGKSKDLRNKCSYLIRILAASDAASSFMFFVTAVAMYLGFQNVSNKHCAYFQAFLVLALNFGNFMILVVGI